MVRDNCGIMRSSVGRCGVVWESAEECPEGVGEVEECFGVFRNIRKSSECFGVLRNVKKSSECFGRCPEVVGRVRRQTVRLRFVTQRYSV